MVAKGHCFTAFSVKYLPILFRVVHEPASTLMYIVSAEQKTALTKGRVDDHVVVADFRSKICLWFRLAQASGCPRSCCKATALTIQLTVTLTARLVSNSGDRLVEMMTPHIVDHFAFPSEFNVLRDMYKFVE